MAVRLDSCTECWVLLIMSSTGNDVWGAALSFSVCVREGECGWEENVGGGGECVCVCNCLCLHSTADAWAVLSAIDIHPYLLHTYIATPTLPVVYCSTLTHPYPVLIMDNSPWIFKVKLDS